MIAAQQNSMIRKNHETDLSATPPNAILSDIFDCWIFDGKVLSEKLGTGKSGDKGNTRGDI